MQVLCDLRPTFLKCNCQTPGSADIFFSYIIGNFDEILYDIRKYSKASFFLVATKKESLYNDS